MVPVPKENGISKGYLRPAEGIVSVYARGRDYHKVLRSRLQKLGERLAIIDRAQKNITDLAGQVPPLAEATRPLALFRVQKADGALVGHGKLRA